MTDHQFPTAAIEDVQPGQRIRYTRGGQAKTATVTEAPKVYPHFGIVTVTVREFPHVREFLPGRPVEVLPPLNNGLARCPRCRCHVPADHQTGSTECEEARHERVISQADRD